VRNRELRLALLLVLVGAALVLLGAGRAWVDVVLPQAPPLPARSLVVTGSDLAAALSPLALVGLAGVAALAASRGLGRVVVGVLLAAAGAGVLAATAGELSLGASAALARGAKRPGVQVLTSEQLGFTFWPAVTLGAGVLLMLGGLLVAVRGRRWAALSARYEAPAARAERPPSRPEVQAWEALDRGEDPTGDGPPAGRP